MKGFRIFLMFIPLLFGSLIYIIFRSERLLMFRWFEILNLNCLIHQIRYLNTFHKFPDWFIYNLPDGLWMMSYVLISIEIWNKRITKQNIFWICIIPFVAIISEVFQNFKVIGGTFDVADFIFYILGTFIPFIFTKNLNLIITKNHEKF